MRRAFDFLRSPIMHEVWPMLAVALALLSGYLSWRASADARDAVQRIEREGRERRDQTCTRDERRFASEVRSLRQTYDYFLRLSPAERKTDRIAAVVDLVEVEQETRDERPPPFCSAPGLGLPAEQVPEIPERPRELRDRP
jgi:hypothetical protein